MDYNCKIFRIFAKCYNGVFYKYIRSGEIPPLFLNFAIGW